MSNRNADMQESVMVQPCVVAFPFMGGEFGGSDISAAKLIASLDPTKVVAIIILHDGNGDFSNYLREVGLPFIHIDGVGALRPAHGRSRTQVARDALSYPSTVIRLRKLLRQHKVDIVHTNNGLIHTTWALPAALAGTKFLWHHRGDPMAKGVNIVAPLFADHIVTVSNFSRPAKPILSIGSRTSVVHSPFEHPQSLPNREACRMDLIKELGLSESTRLVGYFGALIDRKRPLLFVEAIHAFCRDNPDIPVAGLLFGSPEQYGVRMDGLVMERARELGIVENIHIMGFRQPVDPLISAVDMLLVPAVSEPFGRTLIEAMLLGTPVVATDHGGNKEAIRHGQNGFLVEPECADAFVAPMKSLLRDRDLWRRISSNARTEALNTYSTLHHTNQIMEIYRVLLNARPRTSQAAIFNRAEEAPNAHRRG